MPRSIACRRAQPSGRCPFSYGTTINFGEQVSPESAMTAFVVFAPAIHDSELDYIQEHDLEAFWRLDWDAADTTRPPAV